MFLNKILVNADWILNNALDAQFERLGLNRAGLDKVSPSKFFSAEEIARAKKRMNGWVEVLARTGR